MNRREVGITGEKIAAKYLSEHGHKILEQNFRYKRFGEIDIISQNKEYLCFIEVKTRGSLIYGTPAEAVNRKKRENIRKIAQIYMLKTNVEIESIRFDVIEILVNRRKNKINVEYINHIKNAF